MNIIKTVVPNPQASSTLDISEGEVKTIQIPYTTPSKSPTSDPINKNTSDSAEPTSNSRVTPNKTSHNIPRETTFKVLTAPTRRNLFEEFSPIKNM